MKREDTIELENALIERIKDKKKNASIGFYGCEEVTIGFANEGMGKEIVDFITMDSKGIVRCFEIKVTMADLKSKAKKSWYGHYNYLVVSEDLISKMNKFNDYVPSHVGIMVGTDLKIAKRCKKVEIQKKTSTMLYKSMVRSIYHKMNKYKDANNLDKYKKMLGSNNRYKREATRNRKENRSLLKEVALMENFICKQGLYEKYEKIKKRGES